MAKKQTTKSQVDIDPRVQEIYDEIFKEYTVDRFISELEIQPLQHLALSWMTKQPIEEIPECAVLELDIDEYEAWLIYYNAFKLLENTLKDDVK